MGEIAEENTARNPGRTAATAGSLMVGLGLVVFVAVFAAGLTSSLVGSFDDRVAAEYIASSEASVQPVPAQAAQALAAAVPEASVAAQYIDQVEVDGASVHSLTDVLNGVDPAVLRTFYRFDWQTGSDADAARLNATTALVEEQFAKQHHLAVGDRFRLTGPSGATRTMTAIAEYRDPQLLQGVVVDPGVFRSLSAQRDPFALWIAAPAGRATQARLSAALAAFPGVKVRTVDEYRDVILGRVNQIVTMLYALLALSLVIALFGIANSLFLSIHERTRELGMLRAIGATRGQVRALIRFESIITAVIGGLLGTIVGVVFAWLTTMALDDLGLRFRVPAVELVVLLVLAVVVGVVGAVMPARRAARMNVLQAVATGE
jgi:putative ABC transport system permease protein